MIKSVGSASIARAWRRHGSIIQLLGLFVAIVCAGFILFGIAQSQDGEADTVHIVTGLLPPHMDEKGEGREARIIREAFALAAPEIRVKFHVQPFSRHWSSFVSDNRFDGVTTVPVGMALDGNATGIYIHYQNGIGYRRADFPDGFGDFRFDALAGRRVVAFAGAATILDGLNKALGGFALYREERDQKTHSVMLLDRRIDVVVADGAIFFEYTRRLLESGTIGDFAFLPVSCATPYRMVFRNARHQQLFDKGLRALQEKSEEPEGTFVQGRDLQRFGYRIEVCPT